MEKKYVPGEHIRNMDALAKWLETGEPVFYCLNLWPASSIRALQLVTIEGIVHDGMLRFALPAAPEPEAPAEKPARFRRKPTVVEALRWTGKNGAELVDFLGGPDGLLAGMPPVVNSKFALAIRLDERVLAVEPGDYVVRDEHGDIVPLSAKFFAEGYEPVEEAAQ
jgi:hypothetical protein